MVDRHLCGPGTSVGKEFFTLLNMLIAQIQDSHALKSSFLVTMDTEPKNQPRPVCVVPSFRQIDFCISECHPRGGPVEIWQLFRCLLLIGRLERAACACGSLLNFRLQERARKKNATPATKRTLCAPKQKGVAEIKKDWRIPKPERETNLPRPVNYLRFVRLCQSCYRTDSVLPKENGKKKHNMLFSVSLVPEKRQEAGKLTAKS